jgi:hypothetical protein
LNDAQRRWWLDRLQEYGEAERAGEAAQAEWTMREQRYYEQEVFAKGKASLRDMTCIMPAHYPRRYYRLVRQDELPGVPKRLRAGSYSDWGPDGRGGSRRVKVACFQAEMEHGVEVGGHIELWAWTPPELLSFDEKRLCHVPLPPKDIGRHYSLAEICFGLTVLHDADGSFGRIVSPDSPLYEALGAELWVRVVELADQATDAWAPPLEFLFDRIQKALPAPDRIDAGAVKAPRRGRRRKHNPDDDERLAADWRAAKNSGALKSDFAKGRGIEVRKLNNAMSRLRK